MSVSAKGVIPLLRKGYLLAVVVILSLVGCGSSGGAKTALPKGCPPDCAGVSLFRAKLSKVNLQGANLQGADLGQADLTGANLSNADLTKALLTQTDLTGAKLVGAKLTNADMKWAVLRGADLTGADLTGVTISFAPYDRDTKWPQGFDPKAAGAVLAPK